MPDGCLACATQPPAVDALVCRRCFDRLEDRLDELAAYLAILSPQRLRRPAERAAPGFRSASPADDAVLAMTDPRTRIDGEGVDDTDIVYSIPAVLDRYLVAVLFDDPLGQPHTDDGGRSFADQARAGVGLLRGRLDWIVVQEWVGEFAEQVAALHRQLRAVCGDEPPRPIARCFDVTDGDSCEGPVYWQLHDDEAARCSRCGRIYRGAALLYLKQANLGRMA